MKSILSHIAVAFIAIVLYGIVRPCKTNVEVVEKVITDTVVYHHTDTIVSIKPQYITKYVVRHDTIYTTKDSIYTLPITQKHYSKPNLYDAWVSGCNPSLDSIKTYNKIETVVVNNEVIREVVVKEWELYATMGLNVNRNTFMPSVGLSLTTPNKMQYSANVGVYKGCLVYGIGVGFKIF